MSRALRNELATLAAVGSIACHGLRSRRGAWILGTLAVALKLWPSIYVLKEKSIVITGGSRGLGLAVAEQCLREGAYVTLLARESDELARARDLLVKRTGVEPLLISCDVTLPGELARAFTEVETHWGGIDILVNNAGAIVIGPFAAMDRADFQSLVDLQVHTLIEGIQLLLPRWKKRGGRVINICSIGGKIAVPHMSAYCAAKFAMAGLSQALSVELARDKVIVTTVFPGLMRTGSPIQARIKGDHESEYAWFALGDVTPGLSISATKAAKKIVAAIRSGDQEVVFPSTSKLAIFAQSQFPELFACGMRGAAFFFPRGQSSTALTGDQSKGWLERQPWYRPFRPIMDRSRAEFNQGPVGEEEVPSVQARPRHFPSASRSRAGFKRRWRRLLVLDRNYFTAVPPDHHEGVLRGPVCLDGF